MLPLCVHHSLYRSRISFLSLTKTRHLAENSVKIVVRIRPFQNDIDDDDIPKTSCRSRNVTIRCLHYLKPLDKQVMVTNHMSALNWTIYHPSFHHHYHHQHQLQQQQQQRFLSSSETKSTTSFSPLKWWRGRQEKKEEEKYKQRMSAMAEMETWTIGMMYHEINEAASSWTTKLVNTNETVAIKKMKKTLEGIVKIVGEDATRDSMMSMTRKEKLEAAVAGETNVDEVNAMIAQFQTMSLMHRMLRKRKQEGKSIPDTPEDLQSIFQAEGIKVLSKDEKKKLAKQQALSYRRRR
jgi:hypothetical protein